MAFQLGASSSSSSFFSSIPWYEVFLSFRGKDVSHKFISHLYCTLHKSRINTYIDDKLERGDRISLALLNAFEGLIISIIIFSKNYCKEAREQIVLPIFYEVDPLEVPHQKGSFCDRKIHCNTNPPHYVASRQREVIAWHFLEHSISSSLLFLFSYSFEL
ncbi:hypothetical protein I3843_15G099800 [Carya illinoinensis]|nr:hypothetical protein I3843_15G099800 [Carya illinoinensis]